MAISFPLKAPFQLTPNNRPVAAQPSPPPAAVTSTQQARPNWGAPANGPQRAYVPNSAAAQSAARRGTPATEQDLVASMVSLSRGAIILNASGSRGDRANAAAAVFEKWIKDPQAWRDSATLEAMNSKSPPRFDPQDPAITDERISQAARRLAEGFREIAPRLDPK